MTLFKRERAIIADATEAVRDSSTALMVVAGVAIVLAAVAMAVAVWSK